MALQESFVRLYNTGDLDGLVEICYTDDASLLPSNHPRVSGRSQIRQFFHG
jgi:ketosteroid isomerase-like protein